MAKASEGCGTMVEGAMRARNNRYFRGKNTCGARVPGNHRDATDRLAEKLPEKSAIRAQPVMSVSIKLLEIIGNVS